MSIYRILAKFFLRLHNFMYRVSTYAAIKAERGLHPKHRLINYHAFFVDNISSADSVLDIGCGNGAVAYDVAKKARSVTGIDFQESSIKAAKLKYAAENITYIVGDARSDLGDKRFDAIVLSNVLEHIEDREEFLRKISPLARKILIRVPMINRDWITLYKKELGVEWRLDETHCIEYTLPEFQKEMQRAGLEIIQYSVQFGELWAIISSKEKNL